jgi:hypothetical protein
MKRRLPVLADTVAKVENRTTLKISRKMIFRRLQRCNGLWRGYEGPWSILAKTMWSLTQPRAKRRAKPNLLPDVAYRNSRQIFPK